MELVNTRFLGLCSYHMAREAAFLSNSRRTASITLELMIWQCSEKVIVTEDEIPQEDEVKIDIIGGGPAGLYFAIQFLKASPQASVRVFERNERGNTFGWGVVFSDQTLQGFAAADAESWQEISSSLHHWDDIETHYRDVAIRSSGHGFSGIGRQQLLDILTARAEDLGAELFFNKELDITQSKADLIIAADGIFSRTRETYAKEFGVDIDWRHCKYTWLGTERLFDAFTFLFKETQWGWFQAHCYRFSDTMSTFIVECPEPVWRAAGLEDKSKEEGIAFCEELFAEHLQGHKLVSNAKHLRGSASWISFPRVSCDKWFYKNIVLLGDSAASAHFSIGSGTKLAMESALSLASALQNYVLSEKLPIPVALEKYQEERKVEVLKLQSAARNSTEWFENVSRRAALEPEQFNYSLLTRSQRVSHENLRERDRGYLESVESWFAEQATGKPCKSPVPPMFVPLELRGIELKNRVGVSPMDMYSASEGLPGDFHLVHLGQRALGGAALVFTEMTCVSAEGRITPGCAGMYTDEHVAAWKRITDFVHSQSQAKIAIQLGHAGRKGSTRVAWEGMDVPLESGNWKLYAPSPLPYKPENQIPLEMTREDMNRVREDFVLATHRAQEAGFDLVELHCAHGYLLSTFISPLTNLRTDEYGGSLENRLKYPLEVFGAMREVWPADKPMSVRISACDWVENGTTADDAVKIAASFRELGLDIIDVSSGQVSAEQKPVYGRMYQAPFSDRIRSELRMKTMTVGNIYEPDHVNSIIASGRADFCLLARPHLADPHWTLRAGAELGFHDVEWPKQYFTAKSQLYKIFERAKAMTEAI